MPLRVPLQRKIDQSWRPPAILTNIRQRTLYKNISITKNNKTFTIASIKINIPYQMAITAWKTRSTVIWVLLARTGILNQCFQWINIRINTKICVQQKCKMELNVQIITAMHCHCLRGCIKLRHEIFATISWKQWCTEHMKRITDNIDQILPMYINWRIHP